MKKIDKKGFLKKGVAFWLSVMIVVSCIGCGKEKTSLFHICQRDLSYEETLVFGYIYGMTYNLKDTDAFDDLYEGEQSYGEYCKGQIQKDIIDTMLLYYEAGQNKLALSSEEKKKVSADTSGLIEYYGEKLLEGANINKKDVEAVYYMKALANKYITECLNEEEDEIEKRNYVKVYQVTFLTAKLDEKGNYDIDENGDVVMMDSASVSEKKQEAETFSTRAKEGEDIQSLVDEYGASVIGAEKYVNYNDLSKAYKTTVDGLSIGETSQPFAFDYGYYVIKLLSTEGDEYANAVADHDKATKNEEIKNKELQRLKELYIGTKTDYIEKEWDDIKIETFAK